jgi:hypothetical protein
MSVRKGFDGDLAVGTVTGLRWWDLSEDDRLHGSRGPWDPGENIAVCLRYGNWRNVPHQAAHEAPDEDCDCGFWGYWQRNAAPEVGGSHPVLGVVEGYGTTLIGDLGFRCAKARIVALHCEFTVKVLARAGLPMRREHGLWMPDDNMFRRGPKGRETYEALTSGNRHDIGVQLVEDPEALLGVQNCLESIYDVPVYGSFDAMIARHPPTTDYLPPPEGSVRTYPMNPARTFPIADAAEISNALARILANPKPRPAGTAGWTPVINGGLPS